MIGSEAKFVDYYFAGVNEKYPEKVNREELIEAFEIVNQAMLEEIENYYVIGLTILDVMEIEAAKYQTTVEALFVPFFDRTQLN